MNKKIKIIIISITTILLLTAGIATAVSQLRPKPALPASATGEYLQKTTDITTEEKEDCCSSKGE